MFLEQEDEMTESDIHIIEIFGKPYSIAMSKLKTSDEDETLGHFICYLLYEKQVIRKLGIYEVNMSENEMETINHRTFNFEKEKLLLFDEYYEDTTKLQPFMYKKHEDTLSEKTLIELKQSGVKLKKILRNNVNLYLNYKKEPKNTSPKKLKTL